MSQRSAPIAGRHRHRRGVRAAPAERGDAFAGRDPLKTRHHRDLAAGHAGRHVFGGYRLDPGGAMHGGGLDRNLPAQPGTSLDAHGIQGDRQKAGRHLLAGRHHHVIFARIGNRLAGIVATRLRVGGLIGPGHQLVGLPSHGRDHHRHFIPALDFALDERGDMANTPQVGHRGAAEFHRDFRHLCLKPGLPCPIWRPT